MEPTQPSGRSWKWLVAVKARGWQRGVRVQGEQSGRSYVSPNDMLPSGRPDTQAARRPAPHGVDNWLAFEGTREPQLTVQRLSVGFGSERTTRGLATQPEFETQRAARPPGH